MDLMTTFNEFVKNNQLLSTIIGLSGAGIITFWIKDVPKMIFGVIKRELTTELIVTNYSSGFTKLLTLINDYNKRTNFRKFKINEGTASGLRVKSKKKKTNIFLSIGFGSHLVRYKNTFLWIDYTKDSANQSDAEKEQIIIKKFGRSRKLFEDLLEDLISMDNENDTKIFKYDRDWWKSLKSIDKRPMDSIYIESDTKKLIIDTLDKFVSSEDWYKDNSIPYQLGIALYGPPGTGKTSIIKAIAAYLDYNIGYLSSSDIYSIGSASADLPERTIMVIEDIDAASVTESRDDDDDDSPYKRSEILGNLSTILNAMDGIMSTHGRVLIITTNHLEKLDKAIIRPGRIDQIIEIGYVTNESVYKFINNFFPDNTINENDINVCREVTVSDLQNQVLLGKNEYDILSFVGSGRKMHVV